jgi:predicted dehydrogenase
MSKIEKPVRIGIIGTGQIGQRHLAAYANIPEARVVACADLNEAAARAAATTYGIPHVYTSAREMLRREELDAIDVCLHANYHASATALAFEAGCHVYCEKPMAGSYRDALAMMESADKHGRKLHIQLFTLFANETRAARELIAQGELGEIYHARSVGLRRRGRPYVDGYGTAAFVQKRHCAGGALYDMGVYHLAQVLYLLGNPEVERISGKTYQKIEMDARRRELSGYDVEELGVGFVRLAGGVTLDCFEAWAAHLDSTEGSVILGSKGGVRLSPFAFYRSFGDLDMSATANLESARFIWNSVRGEGAELGSSQEHWIAALLGRVPLAPSAPIALNTMLISEGIYLSERLGREVTAAEVHQASVATGVPL